ncbi:complement C1q-like protein 4 [Mizuhopecten yessoensis]|uniref:Caprin-2 n=1 Tax=Mizuhopecten yessoensis TaxID=6573 RepID=A0A210QVZ8_MIZYE|nr:complement C1q-like protein 4 [Mizuhopecten yessoensis]OWF52832.1 Caprin-2 [Mizuhopecten yessoensis]
MLNVFIFGLCFLSFNGINANVSERISKLESQNTRLRERLHDHIKTYNGLLQMYVDKTSHVNYADPDTRQRRDCHTRPSPIAFHALMSQSIFPLGAKQILQYDDVITNVGNAYDKFTGIFQAPIGGVYEFVATMWSREGYHMDYEMLHNGIDVCYGQAGKTNQTMGVCVSVLSIASGDRVWVRNHATGSVYVNGHGYPAFSGHLVA